MKLFYVDLRHAFSGGLTGFGPLLPFGAVCMPAFAAARMPALIAARPPAPLRGQVARGTFSGPRSRGTGGGPRRATPSTPAKHTQSQDTANGSCARTPSHLPWPPRGTPAQRPPPRLVAGRWWCPRAQAPFAVSWLFARVDGDDASVCCGPRWCPASVGRRTGAPPPPWGAVGCGLSLHGRPVSLPSAQSPALGPEQACAQRRTLVCAQRRTAAKGRKQPLTTHRRFMRHESRQTRWSN